MAKEACNSPQVMHVTDEQFRVVEMCLRKDPHQRNTKVPNMSGGVVALSRSITGKRFLRCLCCLNST